MKKGGFRDPIVAFAIVLALGIAFSLSPYADGPTGYFFNLPPQMPEIELQTSHTIQLLMTKSTIDCTVSIFQDADNVTLYTCGDVSSVGGAISCDANASGSSSSTPTTNLTCSASHAFGAFYLKNNGTNATLNATLLNLTMSGKPNFNLSLDNYIIDDVGTPGCAGASCNNCPAADTLGCFKDTDPGSATPSSVLECDNFVSGGAVCQCFSIHATGDAIHRMRAGENLQFVVLKSLITPASSPCP